MCLVLKLLLLAYFAEGLMACALRKGSRSLFVLPKAPWHVPLLFLFYFAEGRPACAMHKGRRFYTMGSLCWFVFDRPRGALLCNDMMTQIRMTGGGVSLGGSHAKGK